MPGYDDYIVYVDESGDHSLEKVDANYPMFVLAFCLFEKERYLAEVAPDMIRLKFKHLGHDQVILHERDIRKQRGDFAFLRNAARREHFLNDLNVLVEQAPYHLALEFGLERLYRHLFGVLGCGEGTLHIVFEKRGTKEDRDLELEFRRVCDGHNARGWRLPFAFVLADKKGNSTGLQLADLVARPIGNRVLRPDQPNRSWDILQGKLRRSPGGRYESWGLKIFP